MRLKHIKLAGFKSFVDPTKVPFEQQMTAIVGPNGCGKSNIIDAVRWVLGESSAKNLRGDSMTDVIFNGAASRKAIGQASVELMFDNVVGRLEGSMADRNQISVRRLVNRESQNSYFLNGTKCRRKDITDIFLGTGLGPRSYAIIEQGTISRLIESKPQELRVFIEEAAGISKYKERRRETENRIKHTRENLERLSDIRFELDIQIDKLHQQAQAAKRFRTLKGEERLIKAELAALRWQKFDEQNQEKRHKISENQQKISEVTLKLRADEEILLYAKQQLQSAYNDIQSKQDKKIQLTNDVVKLEQHLKHVQEQSEKRAKDDEERQKQTNNTQQLLLNEQQLFADFEQQIVALEPNISHLSERIDNINSVIGSTKVALDKEQSLWHKERIEQQSRQQRQLTHAKVVSELTTKHLNCQEQLEKQQDQLTAIEKRFEDIPLEQISEENRLKDENTRIAVTIKSIKQHIQELLADNQQHTEKLAITKATVFAAKQHQQTIKTQLMQQADWQSNQASVINESSEKATRYVQQYLDVEAGWELAVEMVVGQLLEAQIVDPNDLSDSWFSCLPSLYIAFEQSTDNRTFEENTLASKVSSQVVDLSPLEKIIVVKDENACFSLLPSLNKDQMVICPQGVLMGDHFARKGIVGSKNNYLALEQELSILTCKIKEDEESLNKLQQNESIREQELTNHQLKLEQLIQEQTANQNQMVTVSKNNAQCAQQKQFLMDQHEQLSQEIKLLASQQKKLENELASYSLENESTNTTLFSETDSDKLNKLQIEVERLVNEQQQLKEQYHQQTLLIERTKHRAEQTQQNIARYQSTIEKLNEQDEKHAYSNIQIQNKSKDKQHLQNLLAEMSDVDNKINQLQLVIAKQQEIIQRIEHTNKENVKQLNDLNTTNAELNLAAESALIKAENVLAQLNDLTQNVADILKNMAPNARESRWQAKLISLEKDISQLGAINLAAIDEYESQITRKNFLDQQDQDLNQALSTLESAIEKIDKESRHKFKTTFDKVNQDLQSLFPKVFGGGDAYLALTGDDLLETGVTIMARPPGKKNSTIHLLSGGEKALTALSLVFAIFRLNPAPFCMLDEVDAPLDDANVERFCNLVREMSSTVQFIYISHNKIAMEMASHLTGVTMFEAGVSRMVAVDIDEAVAMAEVS